MSDLIERLGNASLEDLPALLLATKLHFEAQQAEIARLRELAEEAYGEGYSDGMFAYPLETYHEAWSVSDARRALEKKP